MFPVWVQLPAMCRGELSAVIARLRSKCLWSGCKWYWGVKEMPSPLPFSPVIREWSWKKIQKEKRKKKECISLKIFLYHIKRGLPRFIHFCTRSPPIPPLQYSLFIFYSWLWITAFSADLVSSLCVLSKIIFKLKVNSYCQFIYFHHNFFV